MSSTQSSQIVMSSGSPMVTKPDSVPEAMRVNVTSTLDCRRKRKRGDVPNFARSCRESQPPGSQNSGPPPTKKVKQEKDCHAALANDGPLPLTCAVAPNVPGLLEPWENSITNAKPSNEYLKHISDFLYSEVVGKLGLDVWSAEGAAIEIEAKIGHLIDKKTNTRLSLPVTTENVISKDDASVQTIFKSSMTEAQHSTMNAFLNKAFIDSQNPKGHAVKPHTKPRIPMSYIHTRECDTYYELSQAGYQSLPKSINQMLNSRRHSKPKARITTDQKTGRLLAKVIKVRVADLDVYSPKTDYDFRISINLEKSMPEAWQPLVQPRPKSVAKVLRNKDRLSYRHLAYQIDLTQVISSDSVQKEHELEVELSAAELRKHGMLLRDGQPNEFRKLVEGFANNIRILAKGSWLLK